jgi:hypothetical protein
MATSYSSVMERQLSHVRRKRTERRPAPEVSRVVPEGVQDVIERQCGELALASVTFTIEIGSWLHIVPVGDSQVSVHASSTASMIPGCLLL